MVLSTCLVLEHQLTLLVLAAVVCACGAFVTMTLFARSRFFEGMARIGWLFLAAISAGISTWTTHFVAMLGYRPDVRRPSTRFSPSCRSWWPSSAPASRSFWPGAFRRACARWSGGSMLGLSVAGMHYLGMFSYQIAGVIHWNAGFVALSLAASAGCHVLALGSSGARPGAGANGCRPE